MRLSVVAIIAGALVVCSAALASAADPLVSYVDAASLARLRSGQVIKAEMPANGAPTLLPMLDAADPIRQDVRALGPTVGAELLAILPGGRAALDTPQGFLALSNALLAVSTMKGINYWSVSRGKETPLFLQSFAVESAQSTEPIADPVLDAVPGQRDLFTLQEDNSFGKNTYAERFTATSAYVHVKTENLSAITFLLVPVVSPRGLVSHVIVIPAGTDALFYGLVYMKSNVPLGDRNHRVQSLENRLTAMAGWVNGRLAAARPAAAPQ